MRPGSHDTFTGPLSATTGDERKVALTTVHCQGDLDYAAEETVGKERSA
jgi:hypothetical protein